MRARPLCFICLLFLIMQSLMLTLTSGKSYTEIPASSVFYEQEAKTVLIQGQVYQKTNTSKIQILYLKNNVYLNDNSKQDPKLLVYDKSFTEVAIGETILLRGTTDFFESARNRGNFDQALYYAGQRIYGRIWCDEIIEVSGRANRMMESLYRLKMKWKAALSDAMGAENGAILTAMLLGEKSEMDSEIKELYQKNGFGHVLAISGLHISFIGYGIYRLLRKGGLSYPVSGIVSIGVLSLYVLLIGFSVSVFRAYVMLILRIGADVTGRVYDMITALLLAATLTVCYQPLYLTDAGFYLSYGAILGILLVLPAIQNTFRCKNKLVAGGLASLAINVMLFPVLLWFYYEFPIYSILLNVPVILLMSLVLSFGMAGSLFLFWLPSVGTGCLKICSAILNFYEALGKAGVRLPLARAVLGRPDLWKVVCYYAILLLIVLYMRKRKKPKKYIWFLLGITVFLISLQPKGSVTVTMLDVGQGDGIFLRGPEGMTYFIDGGSSDVNQLGKSRIEPFLEFLGVGSLDYVFLTHGDADHYSGIEEMLKRQTLGVKINTLVLPANFRQDEALLKLARQAQGVGVKVVMMQEGDCLAEEGMKITCMQPSKKNTVLTGNAGSMVLDIRYGSFSMLCTGDLEAEGEIQLTETIRGGGYDVLKVAHHGSKNSSLQEFLEAVNPKIALISAGEGNRYGHPHEETLERLKNLGCRIYQTMEAGAITLTTDGNSLTISALPFRL